MQSKGKGFANMSMPFILPRGSTGRGIPKRGPSFYPAVYIADPVRMLTRAQIALYSQEANRHLTIELPLRPPGMDDSDNESEDSPESPTRRLFNDIPVGDSFEHPGRQQPLSAFPAHWSPMRPPVNTSTESRARPRLHLETPPPGVPPFRDGANDKHRCQFGWLCCQERFRDSCRRSWCLVLRLPHRVQRPRGRHPRDPIASNELNVSWRSF
jgi:hypothetical protein